MAVVTHQHNPSVVYLSFTILQDLSMSCYFSYLVALDIIIQADDSKSRISFTKIKVDMACRFLVERS